MEKKNMLKEALLEIKGPFGQLLKNLAGDDGEKWLKEFKLFLRQEPNWVDKKAESVALKFIEGVTLPETFTKFSVRYYFIVGLEDKIKPQISRLGDVFCQIFLSKTENEQPKKYLRRHVLHLKSMRDIEIINKLGGPENAFTTLQDIWALMRMQPRGQNGRLLTNGFYNIFYVQVDESIKVKVQLKFNISSVFAASLRNI